MASAQGEDPRAWRYDKNRDRIRSSALGLVNVPTFDFQNRPTFQQVVSFTRARPAGAPAAAPPVRPVTAAPGRLPATGLAGLLAALGAVLLMTALWVRRA